MHHLAARYSIIHGAVLIVRCIHRMSHVVIFEPLCAPGCLACMQLPYVCLVMELAACSLHDVLHVSRVDMNLIHVLHISLYVARGLAYLHAHRLVHRWVKACWG